MKKFRIEYAYYKGYPIRSIEVEADSESEAFNEACEYWITNEECMHPYRYMFESVEHEDGSYVVMNDWDEYFSDEDNRLECLIDFVTETTENINVFRESLACCPDVFNAIRLESAISSMTSVIKRDTSETTLKNVDIVFCENDNVEAVMTRFVEDETERTEVWITWNDGNEDVYICDIPLERMIKINKDLRITGAVFKLR